MAIAAVVGGSWALSWVGGALASWQAQRVHAAHTLDPADIPELIDERLDACAKPCRVYGVGVYDTGFTVTIPSPDTADKSLTYRIEPMGSKAEIMFDSSLFTSNATFDPHTDVDWKLVSRLTKELKGLAAEGKQPDSLGVRPCPRLRGSTAAPGLCVSGSILTPKGTVERVIDAKTGEPR